MEQPLVQLLLLRGVAVAVVALFHRLRSPAVLGYLLVGVLLGPYTPGPVIEGHQLRLLAEYGIVFLLFTGGLSFSLPQLRAMRHMVLALGSAQVVLTTAVVGVLAWLAGLPAAAAFVVGAVFAQSSTTIICRQLEEQREEQTRRRIALLVAVGGEFGFALLAIGFGAGVIGGHAEQVALMSVLLSMVVAPFLIRYNLAFASRLARLTGADEPPAASTAGLTTTPSLDGHVIVCSYGRVGHTVATLLDASGVPFVAYDTDLARVSQGAALGHRVLYDDVSDPGLLAAGRAERAALQMVGTSAGHVDQLIQEVRDEDYDLVRNGGRDVADAGGARDRLE